MFHSVVNSLRRTIAPLTIGVKTTLQYKLEIVRLVAYPLLSAVFLSVIWGYFYGNAFFPYFIITMGLLESIFIHRNVLRGFETFVRRGWLLTIGKPLSPFNYIFLERLGENVLSILSGLLVVLYFMKMPLASLLVFIALLPFLLLFTYSFAYFLSGLAYFFYEIWGISVLSSLLMTTIGGAFFPLNVLANKDLALLDIFPFSHAIFHTAESMISGQIHLASIVMLSLWSAILLLVGRALHKKGMERFESLGG